MEHRGGSGAPNELQHPTLYFFVGCLVCVNSCVWSGAKRSPLNLTDTYLTSTNGGGLDKSLQNKLSNESICSMLLMMMLSARCRFHVPILCNSLSADLYYICMYVLASSGTNICQVVWLNRCLKRFPALIIIPAYQVAMLLSTVIGGGVYFDEFKAFSMLQWLCFTLGLAGCVGGVVILSKREVSESFTEAANSQLPMAFAANGGRSSASAPVGPFLGLEPAELEREQREYSERWRAAIKNPLCGSSPGGGLPRWAAAPRGQHERWVRREVRKSI